VIAATTPSGLRLISILAVRRVLQNLGGQIEHRRVSAPHRGEHDLLRRLVQRLALLERERPREALGRLLQRGRAILQDLAPRVDVLAPRGNAFCAAFIA
jgi:hypothetical protein